MKATILPLLPLVFVFILVSTFSISLAIGLSLGHIAWSCLCQLLPLLAITLLFYVENLLVLRLLSLRLSLVSVALLGVSAITLELFAVVLFLQPSVEVVVGSAILLEFVVEIFDCLWLFPG